MKAKISIAVIVILAVVGLLWINRPTETIQTVSATPTAEPTVAPTATPEPTAEPTPTPIVEVAESIDIEVSDEGSGVSEESIVDVSEEVEVEEPAEEAEEAEATPTPEAVQEVEATPALEVTEPSPTPAESTPTLNPNVTTKSEADKQAELQAEALRRLEELGITPNDPSVMTDRTGNTHGFHGNGTKYGDLQ